MMENKGRPEPKLLEIQKSSSEEGTMEDAEQLE
jgi:hypothetical protein